MPDDPLSDWIDTQGVRATRALRGAVSATHLCRTREKFGWQVRPVPGSVLASPRSADWDPEPDYFHHWVRDAAVVMRVLPGLLARASDDEAAWWRRAFSDYVLFSLRISDPDSAPLTANPLGPTTAETHLKYLRPDAELGELRGSARLAEPRCAADGTPDLERWSRPQHDGPALRASSTIAVTGALPDLADAAASKLIRRDLAHTAEVAGQPCAGPWEEIQPMRHGFTLIAQWDALTRGADWLAAQGEDPNGLTVRAEELMETIEATADPQAPAWKASVESDPGSHDSATVLAILHAGRRSGPLAQTAPRTLGTIDALKSTFGALYPMNSGQAVPAIGRSASDVFFGGNPWLPVTLGFAEMHYDMAVQTGNADHFLDADRWMSLIRSVTPPDGRLSEQIDRETGFPVSSGALSWSAAAFLGAAEARNRAIRAGVGFGMR